MSESLKVGVTGAAGYIGSRIAADQLDAGHDVIAVDNFYEPKIESIEGQRILDVDIRNREVVRQVFRDADVVMHLAAITGIEECEDNTELAFDVNVVGTENVAWLCREWGTPLVFPASMAIIGDPVEFPISTSHPRAPLNQYGLTKAMSEEDIGWLADGGFPALVFMKSNLYGHHRVSGVSVGKRTVINMFVERALAGEPLTVHEPGTQSRDFVHVRDVARAYQCSLDHLADADDGSVTVPIASGESRSVLEIANLVQRVVEEERNESVSVELIENPRGADETVADDFDVDVASARDVIGFEAEYTLERGVREMVARGAD